MTEPRPTPNDVGDAEVMCVVSSLNAEPERAVRLARELADRLGLSLALVDARSPLPAPITTDVATVPVAPPAIPPTVADHDAPATDLGHLTELAGV